MAKRVAVKKTHSYVISDLLAQTNSLGRVEHLASAKHAVKMFEYSKMGFKVGHVLIRKHYELDRQSYEWTYAVEKINDISARKYLVIHVDEYGIPTLARLAFNGNITDVLYLANLESSNNHFEIDPEQQDFILMGGKLEDYDVGATYRRTT